MPKVLTKIKPLHPQLIPPNGAEVFGVTPDGKQLYRLVHPMARSVPDIDPETGEQAWRRHGVTNEPLVAKRKPEIYENVRVFYLESEGNGNVRMIPWAPPSPKELADAARRLRLVEVQEELVEGLVDSGISPAQLLQAAKDVIGAERGLPEAQPATTSPTIDPGEPPQPPGKWPKNVAPKLWQLSDGTKFKGFKVEAVKAQAQLERAQAKDRAAARAVAAATPDF
jgi:hypothetical protein